ncbi:MAG: NAD(P)H-dependent D-xylose reductase (XR) [Cirrosporium novae-zelandiae]|nr:MAG: NAD(P)H-dependent D-xylose reductase (XR) [Cirrosporium novae-zelandiae]
MPASPTVKLASGHEMPLVGFGTWKLTGQEATDAVYQAIKMGYRLIDCAQDYDNEKEVGAAVRKAIADGLVKREELFLVSKIWNQFHDFKRVEPMCRKQLEDWGVDYFDLYLMHFPLSSRFVDPAKRYPPNFFEEDGKTLVADGEATIQETWTAMEHLVDRKIVRSIGISNFQAQLLMDLLRYARIPPSTLQIEHHPYLVQPALVKYAQQHGLRVTAYSSFGTASFLEMGVKQAFDTPLLFDHPVIKKIAEAHGKTCSQVLLRWSTQREIAVLPKATDPTFVAMNLDSTSFDLTEKEFEEIDGLDRKLRFNDPLNYGFFIPCFA